MNKKISILLLFISIPLFSSEGINLFTNTKKEILELEKKIINEDKKVDEKDWLSNINVNTDISKDKDNTTTKTFSLSYNQDIFRFGAISNIIDMAQIQEEYSLLDLDITFDNYINEIYTNVLNAKLTDLNIEKQKFSLKNEEINLNILKEEYKAGETDVTTLNDAIMDKNALEEEIISQENSKYQYLRDLRKYTNLDYDKIDIPNLKIKDLDTYLKESKDVKLASLNQELKKYIHKINKSDYLPKVSFNTNYSYDFSEETISDEKSYNYGLSVSIPFSFSSLNSIESSQVNYLLAKKELEQTKIDETNDYEKSIKNIEKYKKLNNIVKKDIALYDELLSSVEDEYKAGFKAIEDVEILSNTKSMRELDIRINNLNIILELISIYY
ncbi:TolC family protein [Halarcobacter sp.]|uniref:TolC family protein n=1 Tax=Halarcobacter sp. TaxID=2321133 RepID=UPI0029F5CC79|nr:TolC family protein [Halarcobacter sp.]